MSDDISRQIEEFLARGGKIKEVPQGTSCGVPIIVSVSPDGTVRNDYHQQEKSRKRPREKSSIVVFPQPKKPVGASGRVYIRVREFKGETQYVSRIQGVHQGEWNKDIEIAIKLRNESLVKRGIPIPD